MSNVVKKVGGAIGIGPKKPTAGQQMMEKAVEVVKADQPMGTADQMAAQQGAAAARKRRGGRAGQRSLLYASRLGGGGAGRGEDQSTLGAG